MWKKKIDQTVLAGVDTGYLVVGDCSAHDRKQVIDAWCMYHDMHHTTDLLIEKHKLYEVRLDLMPACRTLSDQQIHAVKGACARLGRTDLLWSVAPTYVTIRVTDRANAEHLAREILGILGMHQEDMSADTNGTNDDRPEAT